MGVDHFFTMGKTHRICEDYALSGIDPFPYLIVADGCSSSPYTDVGARILAHTAYSILKMTKGEVDYEGFGRLVIVKARLYLSIGLPSTCLDSTLIVAFRKEGSYWKVFRYGDGGLVFRRRESKKVEYAIGSFSRSMPYYLNYWFNPTREEAYKQEGIEEIYTYSSLEDGDESKLIHDVHDTYVPCFKDIDLLMILSDGMTSFVDQFHLDSPPSNKLIVKTLTDIKSTKGKFIQRRAKRMLQSWARESIYHLDDFSIAAWIEDA